MSLKDFRSYNSLVPAKPSAVGGCAYGIKSEIKMSLCAIIKDGTALASLVPCLSWLAGLVLYLLQMYNDVRQCKREWQGVAQKLYDIASLVISVGELCESGVDVLSTQDFAPLRTDLLYFLSELTRISEILEKCAKSSRIKMIFMRAEILFKIRQCDGMLAHTLSIFQTKMTIRIHLMQLAQARRVKLLLYLLKGFQLIDVDAQTRNADYAPYYTPSNPSPVKVASSSITGTVYGSITSACSYLGSFFW